MPKRPARYNGLPKALCLLAASIAMGHASASFAADSLDWVPQAQLTPEQQKKMGPSCSGLYVDPLADEPVPKDLDKQPISVDANGAHVSEGQAMQLK
ncbi:MAG: hypothetical protein EOP50_20755, partial [Sphingobacteriales bacterium]